MDAAIRDHDRRERRRRAKVLRMQVERLEEEVGHDIPEAARECRLAHLAALRTELAGLRPGPRGRAQGA